MSTAAPARTPASLLASEAMLTAVSLAGVVAFCRLFTGWSFLLPLGATAVAAHATAVALRRLRWGAVASTVVGLGGLAVAIGLIYYRTSTAYGLPSRAVWDLFTADLRDSWQAFAKAIPLVHPATGYLVAASIAVWLAALLADAFAFRARAGVEALVPPGIVFVFGSALAADRLRLASTALELACGLGFLLAHRAWRQEGSGGWLTADRRGASRAIAAGGIGVGAIAVLAGVVVGPALPGAHDDGWIDYQEGGGGGGTRVTVSPLVDIRGRLVSQSNVEAFTVAASQPAYWRLTALDVFKGSEFSTSRSFDTASGALPVANLPSTVTTTRIVQDITITGLDSSYLPAALVPVRLDGTHIRYDPETDTLLADRGVDLSTLHYRVESKVPSYAVAQLSGETDEIPADISAVNLSLDNIPRRLQALADSIVAGTTTPYDKARALQDWFRNNFDYDLTVRSGSGINAIDAFLQARRGYCEQFAGTYAILGRLVGLPTRVAVGFTPGDLGVDGIYHVLGRHAHAWPEVYFPKAGWVPFEPTPGRGIPGAQGYTGVAAAQDSDTGTPTVGSTTPSASTTSPSTTIGKGKGAQDPDAKTPGLSTGGTTTPRAKVSPWPGRLARFAAAVALAAVAWVVAIPLAWRLRRDRRRARAGTDAARVLAYWEESVDHCRRAGFTPSPADTHLETAQRATANLALDPACFAVLADAASAAAYGSAAGMAEIVERVRQSTADIGHQLAARRTWRARLARTVDPRPLLAATRRPRQQFAVD